VAKQWKEHDGHASVFAGPREEIRLRITTPTDGPWKLDIQILPVKLDTQLPEYGVSSGEIPRVIAQFNLGRPIELRPEKGPPYRLWYDPKTNCLETTHPAAVPFSATPLSAPSSCPKCCAFLASSRTGKKPKTCPLCGHVL